MSGQKNDNLADLVQSVNPSGTSSIVLVCEHASHFIPASFENLGLPAEVLRGHISWDPGAMEIARRLSERLDASLIAGGVSRLVYDCNRPPSAIDAMPARSEIYDIPGNTDLSPTARTDRAATYYEPFRLKLAKRIGSTNTPIIITIHSFTPVYKGETRSVEIGVLHDSDTRLADAMLSCAPRHTQARVFRNQPYGPEHGVTHTLKEHAVAVGHLNVMLEIRNDLIATTAAQDEMARMIAGWLADAFTQTGVEGVVKCVA